MSIRNWSPPCLLLVDDDPALCRATARLLAMYAIETKWVTRGSEALVLLERGRRFDAYLLDLEMPEMSGIALMRRIRDLVPDAKIALWSGSEDLNHLAPQDRNELEFTLIKGATAAPLIDALRDVFTRRADRPSGVVAATDAGVNRGSCSR